MIQGFDEEANLSTAKFNLCSLCEAAASPGTLHATPLVIHYLCLSIRYLCIEWPGWMAIRYFGLTDFRPSMAGRQRHLLPAQRLSRDTILVKLFAKAALRKGGRTTQ